MSEPIFYNKQNDQAQNHKSQLRPMAQNARNVWFQYSVGL